jgi:hypothetical protein
MISLLFSNLNLFNRLLLFFWGLSVIHSWAVEWDLFTTSVRIYATSATIRIFFMPVLTRYQKRALDQLKVEPSTTITSVIPSSDFTRQDIKSSSSTLDCSDIQIVDDILSLTSSYQQCSSSLPSLNFEIPTNNFEISKFENFDTGQMSMDVCHLCTHNISVSNPITMEADCKDHQTKSSTVDLTDILGALSSQISSLDRSIQNQLRDSEIKLLQENEAFKKNVKEEIDDLRRFIMSTSGSLPTQVSPSSSLPSVPSPVPNVTSSISSSIPVGLSSTPNISSSVSTPAPTDVHSQMMLLMAESFSKLSSVLTEKNTDSKSDWPKFAGDIKKFRTWYLAILAQVSIPPWAELYDPVRNDILSSTSNSTLNGKLYSKLLLALEGTALQNMISRKHLRANGLLLLHELVQTYRPTNVPEVIAAKTSEFWGHTKRSSHETVDQYYNRFHDLLDDLQDAEETILTKSAIRHFIFTLGVEFEVIQNNFRIGNLPAA